MVCICALGVLGVRFPHTPFSALFLLHFCSVSALRCCCACYCCPAMPPKKGIAKGVGRKTSTSAALTQAQAHYAQVFGKRPPNSRSDLFLAAQA